MMKKIHVDYQDLVFLSHYLHQASLSIHRGHYPDWLELCDFYRNYSFFPEKIANYFITKYDLHHIIDDFHSTPIVNSYAYQSNFYYFLKSIKSFFIFRSKTKQIKKKSLFNICTLLLKFQEYLIQNITEEKTKYTILIRVKITECQSEISEKIATKDIKQRVKYFYQHDPNLFMPISYFMGNIDLDNPKKKL